MLTIGGRAFTIDEVVQVCRLGYPFVELKLNHPDKIKPLLNQLLKIKDKFGIYYLAHFPNEGNPADLEKLETVFLPGIKTLIMLCQKLDIKKGTLHFWMDKRQEWASSRIISKKIDLLSQLVDHAAKFNMKICLENLSCRHDSFELFFSEIPDLYMTLDVGHGQLLNKENTAFGFIEHVFDKIQHIHIHDNFGGSKISDDLHLPLGEGIIDYSRIFSLLGLKGYDSTITMEVSPDQLKKTQSIVEHYFSTSFS